MPLILFLFLLSPRIVHGFASWFATEEQYCTRKLQPDEIIMNNVVAESSERSIQVFRNSEQLFSNAIYVPGEVLSIVLSDISGQYVIESSVPGSFEEGGCEGRRVTESPASITMPSGGTQDDVLITAGWAFGHSQVMVTPAFFLKARIDSETNEVKLGVTRVQESDEESLNQVDKASKDGEAGSVGGKGLQLRGANLALLRSSTHSPAFLYIMLAVIVLLTAIISYKFYFWFKYGKYISKGN